ncbi:MAG: 2-phosphosulfolactate phosphatase [Nitrospinota bacterium]|nr:2-phosphosulfolactate phosphatase [Nitrospinota bacterium]
MTDSIFFDVAFSYSDVEDHINAMKTRCKIKHKEVNCAVVDVLRATTTIISSLHNGCSEIYPVASRNAAIVKTRELKKKHINKKILLAGEKNGKAIKGFDLGNSPSNFKREIVRNKIIIMSTSNGTKAINAVKKQENVFLFSLANLSAVAKSIISPIIKNHNLLVVCSGSERKYCEEDSITSGLLIQKLISLLDLEQFVCSDSTKACLHIANSYKKNILQAFKNCSWGEHLIQLGLKGDLEFCSKMDWSNVVPKLKNGIVISS